MQLEDYLDFSENRCSIRLKGYDVGLEHIVKLYQLGYSAESIRQKFRDVPFEQLYGAITYYLHNRSEIDAYVARIEAQHAIAVPDHISPDEKIRAVIREHEHEWIVP